MNLTLVSVYQKKYYFMPNIGNSTIVRSCLGLWAGRHPSELHLWVWVCGYTDYSTPALRPAAFPFSCFQYANMDPT